MDLEVQDSNLNDKTCPIWKKILLTAEEASEYSGIGINKIRDMLKEPKCPFVLYYGNRKLVKRKELENYLLENTSI